ncbi:MAG: sulfite exporter TauE/SafE family protein [Pseudomonadota bacterium]
MNLLDGDPLWVLMLVAATSFSAAFVRGLAGFGFAILLVPVLAIAVSPPQAVLMTNVIAASLGLLEIRWILRNADTSAFLMAICVALVTPVGFLLLTVTPSNFSRAVITFVSISAFVAVFRPRALRKRPRSLATVSCGAASGFLTGFAGMPGPPVIPYYLAQTVSREIAKASMQLVFTVAALSGLAAGLVTDDLRLDRTLLGLCLLPIVFAGNLLGARAFGKISEQYWHFAVATVLAIAAAGAVYRLIWPD